MIDEKASLKKGMSAEEIQQMRRKKKEELNEQQRAELLRSLSIRERLERKLQTDEINLELNDDLGKFILKFRKLSPVEHDRFATLQRDLIAAGKDIEKTKTVTDEIYDIVGAISLDGLDAEFWRTGTGYSPDVLISIILKVMTGSSYPDRDYMEGINSFRQK